MIFPVQLLQPGLCVRKPYAFLDDCSRVGIRGKAGPVVGHLNLKRPI